MFLFDPRVGRAALVIAAWFASACGDVSCLRHTDCGRGMRCVAGSCSGPDPAPPLADGGTGSPDADADDTVDAGDTIDASDDDAAPNDAGVSDATDGIDGGDAAPDASFD